MDHPVIIWLRRDLRLSDHAPLAEAAASGRPVVPVFLADADAGDWRPGAASRWWLHHSLTALDTDLRACGSRLVVLRGDPLKALLDCCRATGAKSVWWHRLYEPGAVADDTRIKTELNAAGIEARSHTGALLHEPANRKPYRVFTPFWKSLVSSLDPGVALPAPARLRAPQRWPDSVPLDALALLPRVRWDAGLASAWRPGEAGGLARLETFCAGAIADYDRTRDLPAVDGVSRLSPHLHFGEVSPRQAWLAARAGGHDTRAGVDVFLRELGWREFAHAVLFHFPHTPTEPLYEKYRDFPWREDSAHLLEAWQRGETGIPLVDAGMRELWHTGWMHNRVRMVAASFLVKNLRVPWQAGARWFWDTLVDADLANNTLGWQWSAGCGADAAPYFRIFNPLRQAERFDPEGAYIRRWAPEDRPPVVDLARSREEALAALKSMGDRQ